MRGKDLTPVRFHSHYVPKWWKSDRDTFQPKSVHAARFRLARKRRDKQVRRSRRRNRA